MPQFRTKPTYIQAVKWNGYSNNIGLTNGEEGDSARYEMPSWLPPISRVLEPHDGTFSFVKLVPHGEIFRRGENLIVGVHGYEMLVKPGDWIVRREGGTIFGCPSDMFDALYEKVGGEA